MRAAKLKSTVKKRQKLNREWYEKHDNPENLNEYVFEVAQHRVARRDLFSETWITSKLVLADVDAMQTVISPKTFMLRR